MRLLLAVTIAALSTGCATTLSTLQTATPIKRGQVAVTGATGLYVNAGPLITVIDQGIQQGSKIKEATETGQPYELSEEAKQELITAGIALAVMHPWQGYEISARTGVLEEDMDVGLRYSVNALRVDTKYRFLHKGNEGTEAKLIRQRSFDMAVGLAVSRYVFDDPVFTALEYVRLDDFSRWDFEVPVYASADVGDIFKLYGAAKYVYSYTKFDANLVNYSQQASNISGLDVSLPADVHAHFVGATAGVALGYRWVHAMVELTGGYTFCNPVVFGERRSLGGPTIYPAIGLGVKVP